MSPASCEQIRRLPGGAVATVCALALLLVGVPQAGAQKPAPGDAGSTNGSTKRVLTLDQSIQIALRNNAEIKERQAGVAGARAP